MSTFQQIPLRDYVSKMNTELFGASFPTEVVLIIGSHSTGDLQWGPLISAYSTLRVENKN